MKKIDK